MDSPVREALGDILKRVGRDPEHPPSLSLVLGELASSVGQDVADSHKALVAEELEHRFLGGGSGSGPVKPPPPTEDDDVDDAEMDALIPDPANKATPSKKAAVKGKGKVPPKKSKKAASAEASAGKRKKSVKEKLQQTKEKKVKKVKKIPGQPPKPRNAYQIFQDEMRPTIRSQHPSATFGEVAKLLGSAWKDLTKAQKEAYLKLAEKEKVERTAEIKEWMKNNKDLLEKHGLGGSSPKTVKVKTGANIAPLNVKIPKKLRKREVQHDEGDVDMEPEQGEVVEQVPKTAFDQALEQNKKSKKRFVIDEDTIQAGVQNLLSRMDAAFMEDLQLIDQKKPATKKLAMSKEVVTWMSK
jgi:hypothetical protein